MPDLGERALDTAAQNGATYADVRLVRRRRSRAHVKCGRVEAIDLARPRASASASSSTVPGASRARAT